MIYNTKHNPTRILCAAVLVISMCLTMAIAVLADNEIYDHTYAGADEYGYFSNGYQTAILSVKDSNGNILPTYCVDATTMVQDASTYSRENVGDAGYYTAEAADHIRAIIQNSYPFITLKQVREKSGIARLSEKEAITGTQLAIWHYANGESYKENGNIASLYQWLLSLPAAQTQKTPIGEVLISAQCSANSGKYDMLYRFRANGKNMDNTSISLSYSFSEDIQSKYNAKIENLGVKEDGYTEVRVSGLPADASFVFSAYGTQNVSFDGYFYSPQGGRLASQSMVGAYTGSTTIRRNIPFAPEVTDQTIRITKVDSVTLESIAGAEFEVANTNSFDDVVYTMITDEDGVAQQSGLSYGTWYIREKNAPAGYIKDNEIYEISVGHGISVAEFKNTAYGGIKIVKMDNSGKNVQGAAFNIYKGDTAKAENLLFEGLVSDENGVILSSNLEPGTYTVKETAAPYGWHLNDTPVTVEIEPGELETIVMENKLVVRGTVKIIKRDAVSDVQLAGAVIGVYADAEYTQLIEKVTTSATEAIAVDNLMPGTYYIKEISVPQGYLLDSTPLRVTLAEGEEYEAVFYDNKPPITAGNYGIFLVIGLSMMIGLGTAGVVFRKKIFTQK